MAPEGTWWHQRGHSGFRGHTVSSGGTWWLQGGHGGCRRDTVASGGTWWLQGGCGVFKGVMVAPGGTQWLQGDTVTPGGTWWLVATSPCWSCPPCPSGMSSLGWIPKIGRAREILASSGWPSDTKGTEEGPAVSPGVAADADSHRSHRFPWILWIPGCSMGEFWECRGSRDLLVGVGSSSRPSTASPCHLCHPRATKPSPSRNLSQGWEFYPCTSTKTNPSREKKNPKKSRDREAELWSPFTPKIQFPTQNQKF